MFRGSPRYQGLHAKALLGAGLAVAILFIGLAAETGNLPAQIASLILGGAAALYLGSLADRRLRARGKSIWWLPLFFGPFLAGVMLFERLPRDNDEVMILALVAICIVCAPFAIWGMVELTGAPRRQD